MFFRRKRNRPSIRRPPEKPAPRASAVNRQKTGGKLFAKWTAGVDWPVFRISIVIGLFAAAWLGLWARAWHLQMIEGPKLADRAKRQHVTSELVTAERGLIFDRSGQVLARSVQVRSVYARPAEIEDIDKTAAALAPILGMDAQKLRAEFAGGKKFIWLKRKVDDATADATRKAALPGIGLSREYERFYPFKHMAGQLLGFVGLDDKGLEGLERSLDHRLGAMPVRQTVQRDAMGRRFYLHEEGQTQPRGEDITLTIDTPVQFMAEEAVAAAAREYDARWAGALVVETDSGDILAWAQYPFFNPNAYRGTQPQQYRNRLAADALEPGSTFKPIVMAMALQEKKVTPNTLIDCEGGKWASKNFVIRDTSIRGILPASKVMRYSSNIGMAKIGLSLGAPQFHKYLRSLGFGESTDIPVASSRGILRRPRDWGEQDIMSTAFGQSISVTALQMAQAYLTLVNHGIYKPLRLLMEDSHVSEAPRRIFGERATREVMDMMRDVVESKDGTGRRARVPGVEIAGKTGTAQKADARSKTYGDRHLASFVGFFPAMNPKYLILVLVDEPAAGSYGGTVAAPAFRSIASRLLTHTGVLNETAAVAENESKTAKKRGLKLSAAPEPPWRAAQTVAARQNQEMRFPGHLAKASSLVPDVKGKSVRNAVELFARAGIVPELKGNGSRVVRQSPPPGAPWPAPDQNTNYILWLSER